jgi:cupin fold WbuC family metalloprotein
VPGIQVPVGQYHTCVCLEDGSVIFEAKNGPYEPIGPADILSM